MAFFKKLKERLFKSSSKIDEGLSAIVDDGGEVAEAEVDLDTGRAEQAAEARAHEERQAQAAREEAEAAEAERVAAQQAAAREAEAQAVAAAEAERKAQEQAQAERRAEEERLAAERAELERIEQEARAEKERLEAERIAAARAAELEAQRAEAEAARLAQEQAEAEKRAAEQAAALEDAARAQQAAEAAAEAERARQAAEAAAEAERARQAAEAAAEAERARQAAEAAAEAERARQAAEAAAEAERARQAAEAAAEAERARQEAEAAAEAERARQAAEAAAEAERAREAEDAERARQEAERAEQERQSALAAERARNEAEAAQVASAEEDVAQSTPKPGFLGRLFGRREKKAVLRRTLDDDMLEQLEELLITADMGVDTALRVTANMAEGRFGKKLSVDEIKSLMASEIARIMEPVAKPMPIYPKTPQVVLVVGVNGSGKTTTIGKLASQFRAAGKKVVIAAGDTFRAAAVEQLQVWGERAGVPVLTAPEGSDPASLAFDAMTKAQADGADLLMIDTAGRLQNRSDLMEELAKIVRVIRKHDETAPHNTLLVLDATTGQNALSQVKIFQDVSDVSGLVMTKLDGTAKGGVLVALADKFGLPIHAIGVGEQIDDLAPFDPEEFAAALTGLEVE